MNQIQKNNFICFLTEKSSFHKKSLDSGAVGVIADSSEFAFRNRYMTDRNVTWVHTSQQCASIWDLHMKGFLSRLPMMTMAPQDRPTAGQIMCHA